MNEGRQIRLGFVIRGAVIGIAFVVLIAPILAGVLFIAGLTRPSCGGAGRPESFDSGFEDITVPAPSINTSATMRAYFITAQDPPNGTAKGTIIGVPTGSAGRADRIHELRFFYQAGYNVLAFESRTCAAGLIASLGYQEVDQVGDALEYLRSRPDIDMDRIGIHGFSAGGATAIMAAARYDEIDAVVAQGGYHDFFEEVTHNTTQGWSELPLIGDFFRFGVRIGYRAIVGVDIRNLSPISVIGQIAPRPALLVYGSDEPGIRGAQMMLDEAGQNVELWIVPAALHGGYMDAVGEPEYKRQVIGFWDRVFGE
jgi:hypothetical protein